MSKLSFIKYISIQQHTLQPKKLYSPCLNYQKDVHAMLLLSHFSRVRLCATPQTAAHQAPPSLGFSRQEHWSGLPFPSPMIKVKGESEVTQSCPTLSDPMGCSLPGFSVHGIFQARVLEWRATTIFKQKSLIRCHQCSSVTQSCYWCVCGFAEPFVIKYHMFIHLFIYSSNHLPAGI